MKRIDEQSIVTIMMLAADAVQKANSGHPGMPMGDATMAYVLWQYFLKHNPRNPQWHNRDRFVLSAGHGSMLLYSLLYLTGHNISMDDIKNFRQWESPTPGHPEYCLPCGIETTTGPLGQGFATGVGMAMAEKFLAKAFNKPGFKLVDYYIYGIVSDGDIMEGVQAEAASLAGHLGLGKIIYLYSDNKITIEGSTDLAFSEDVDRRFRAYGWHTEKVDGYDEKAIANAIKKAQQEKGKPSLIIARTHIGYCCPNKQDTSDVHGAPLGEDEIRLAKKQCDFPNRKFFVPKEVLKHMRTAVTKGNKAEAKWNDMFRRYKKKYPEAARTWGDMSSGRLPDGWEKELPKFNPAEGPMATRSASGKVLNALAPVIPNLIGGSSDLAPSNNTLLKGFPHFTAERAGRNIHFGVREHAMGAVLNGMALSKMLIPYGGTFLIFSDYLRPASRLSALMETHVVYVMTHDSVGLGEDGPTHQPVEHLTSYRAMPNMTVIRPCDANETVEAWRLALKNTSGPVMLVLSRQKLPVLNRRQYASAVGVRRGGYIISDSKKKKPDLIFIATGSEVALCLDAADELRRSGKDVRVISMPSCELFDAQPENYRNEVLPPDVTARVAVEAGASLSWHKYVGPEGAIHGIDRFGASAPAKVIFEKLGFTTKNIVAVAKGLKKKRK
jgi:transketolase